MGKLKCGCNPLEFVLFLTLFSVGGFHEYISCAVSAVISVFLILKISQGQALAVKLSLFNASVLIICAFYGLTAFWAVDFGMAIIGFLKFLPVALFLIYASNEQNKESILEHLPYFGGGLVIVSGVMALVPKISSLVLINGRLAGLFEYPNTFAMFLLICELLILIKVKRLYHYITLIILILGLLLTGSRAVFVLAVAANIAVLLFCMPKKPKLKTVLTALLIFALLAAVLLVLFGGIFKRYLNISIFESTFVGRILYFCDALPLLAKHPFGMGYMGYYYSQSAVQTGVYSVAFAHNDILQLALDVGIIPCLLFLAGVITQLANKNITLHKKIITAAFLLHCLFDFNLQFIGMFMLLILLVSDDNAKRQTVINKKALNFVLPIVIAVNLYFCTALGASHLGFLNAADSLYPLNTQNKLKLISEQTDVGIAGELADEVISQNKACYLPYSIKAKQAYSKGDFKNVIYYKNLSLNLCPFVIDEHKEYCQMLLNGISIYSRQGDEKSVEVLNTQLKQTQRRLIEAEQRLSVLGSKIKDKPDFTLPQEVTDYIEKLGKE